MTTALQAGDLRCPLGPRCDSAGPGSDEGVTGVAALSAAVSSVLNDAPLRDELRQTAGGLKSRYSVKAMVDAYVEIIEGL